MVKNKAKIAPESFYNPRASRALKRALDPGRKGLRASRSWCVLCTHESKIFYFQMLAGMQRQSKVGREMKLPQNKGKHKKLCGCEMKQNNVCWKAGRIPSYSRAGTSGEQTVGKCVLRDSRPGKHSDSREPSAAPGRADIMTTLRCTNGWTSAQQQRSPHFETIQREWRANYRGKNRPANTNTDWSKTDHAPRTAIKYTTHDPLTRQTQQININTITTLRHQTPRDRVLMGKHQTRVHAATATPSIKTRLGASHPESPYTPDTIHILKRTLNIKIKHDTVTRSMQTIYVTNPVQKETRVPTHSTKKESEHFFNSNYIIY